MRRDGQTGKEAWLAHKVMFAYAEELRTRNRSQSKEEVFRWLRDSRDKCPLNFGTALE